MVQGVVCVSSDDGVVQEDVRVGDVVEKTSGVVRVSGLVAEINHFGD